MTDAQNKHVVNLINIATDRMYTKYSKGAQEHGGNLWDMPAKDLLDNAIDEAIDQIVYLLTLKEQLDQVTKG